MNKDESTCRAYVRFVNDKVRQPNEIFIMQAKVKQLFRGDTFNIDRIDLATVLAFGIDGCGPDIRNVSMIDLIRGPWTLSTVEPGRIVKLKLQALKLIDEPFVVTLLGRAVLLPVDITA